MCSISHNSALSIAELTMRCIYILVSVDQYCGKEVRCRAQDIVERGGTNDACYVTTLTLRN